MPGVILGAVDTALNKILLVLVLGEGKVLGRK